MRVATALLLVALTPPGPASLAHGASDNDSGDSGTTAAAAAGAAAGTDQELVPTNGADAEPVVTRHELETDAGILPYEAKVGRITIGNDDERRALIFFVSYDHRSDTDRDLALRPLTFVFNGGPGAAAAYLHLGALGPVRVILHDDGTVPQPPARLGVNPLTWLHFTDLVFVDPVGTGYSRLAEGRDGSASGSPDDASSSPSPFWETGRDVSSLAEFIRLYLTRYQRRLSPVFLAGESYGGFRVAALAEKLTADVGVGLNGVVLISPVLEFSLMYGDAYSLLPWAMLLPAYAAAAREHGKADLLRSAGEDLADVLQPVEDFSTDGYLAALAAGDSADQAALSDLYRRIAGYTGLPENLVRRLRGRIPREVFAKRLLEEEAKIVSLYDASIVGIDASPEDIHAFGRDPVLEGLTAPLSSAFAAYVRSQLGYDSELRYELLNTEVFRAWRWRGDNRSQGYVGAADELKAAMSLNSDLRVFIAHGYFDLVTSYFASLYVVDQMALDASIRPNLTLKTYRGGHMFYTHAGSREGFYRDAAEFYRQATPKRAQPAPSTLLPGAEDPGAPVATPAPGSARPASPAEPDPSTGTDRPQSDLLE